MEVANLNVGARGRLRLVRSDADRRALLVCLREAMPAGLLAYCLMDTHVHAVWEGGVESAARRLAAAMRTYLYRHNRRRGSLWHFLRLRFFHKNIPSDGISSRICNRPCGEPRSHCNTQ